MRPDKKTIHEFYKKYKQNLDQVMKLEQEQRIQGADLMEWINKYKDRAQKIYELFLENEEAIKKVLEPIFSKEVPMDDELATDFLEEILQFRNEFYGDSLVSHEVLKYIVEFYEKQPEINLDNYIISLGLMGAYEEVLATNEHFKRSVEYHTKITSFKDYFTVTENPETQRRIFYSFFNRVISETKCRDYSVEKIQQFLEEGRAFYKDEKNRQVEGFDFKGYYRVIGMRAIFATLTLAENNAGASQEFIDKACEMALEEFELESHYDGEENDISVVRYLNYHLAAYRKGKISATKAFDALFERYKTVVSRPRNTEKPHRDAAYFEVLSSYSPEMFCLLKDSEYSREKRKEIQDGIIKEVMSFFAAIPPGKRNDIANVFMLNAFKKVLPYYDITSENLESIMKAAITRESTTAIHTNMVKAIAAEIVKAIIAKKPELFVGYLGCLSAEEVKEKRNDFLTYSNMAAFCHDIGKLAIADIINIQYRKITDTEFEMIREHPGIGEDILRAIPYLRPFADVAYGHHKNYNDEKGYPQEFLHKKSENAIWIDIITLSDCIDAATDARGRIYKKAKSFDEVLQEFKEGVNTTYNGELVELLSNTESLRKTIQYIVNEGRDSYLFAVYRHMDR